MRYTTGKEGASSMHDDERKPLDGHSRSRCACSGRHFFVHVERQSWRWVSGLLSFDDDVFAQNETPKESLI